MSTNAGKKTLKITLILTVFSLVLLAFVLIFCEGAGTWVGKLLDRPAAGRYLRKTYKDLSFSYVSSSVINEEATRFGITAKKKAYRYEYEVVSCSGEKASYIKAGDRFFVEAYNFKVTDDGLYGTYLADRELIEKADSYLLEALLQDPVFEEIGFLPTQAYLDLCIYQGGFTGDLDARLQNLLDSDAVSEADCVLHFDGEKLTFDEYKEAVAKAVGFFKEHSVLKPGSLRIIYNYQKDGASVMQYESQLAFYELNYEEAAIKNGIDMHYYIELDDSQRTQLKVYNTVKYIYIAVVGVSVVALSTYWVVKKVRKLAKQKRAEEREY